MGGFAGCGNNSGDTIHADAPTSPSPSPNVSIEIVQPPDTPPPPPPFDTVIRLGFVGTVPLEYMGLATSTLEGLVRDNRLAPIEVSVGYDLYGVEDVEQRANAIIAILDDFRPYYRENNMSLVVLLSDSTNGGLTIGLFVHDNLRANTTLAPIYVQSLQDTFWNINNVHHFTVDDSYPHQWITAICPHCVTENPQPPPPTFLSYTISPVGSLHVGDNVTITVAATLHDGADGDILVYWYNEAGDIVEAGLNNSFAFTKDSIGIYRFNVVLYSIVMQGDIPRRSRPTDAVTITVDILAGISPPVATPISINIGDVVSARPSPTMWGQYLIVYTGIRHIELSTIATSQDNGTISIQWYARAVNDAMGEPNSLNLSPTNMHGFVPVSGRTSDVFSLDTIMSPTPRAFINTNTPGTFDYIARITNMNNNFPRQNTSYIWTDVIRIRYMEATPPPYRQLNVFFNADDSDITLVTEELPSRYHSDQDARIMDFVAYLNTLQDYYEIVYIQVEGRFNNVSNVQPPYTNLIGVRLTRERAHIVRDRLIQLGITAPIYTRYNYRQDSAAYMQRRATVTVRLRRL